MGKSKEILDLASDLHKSDAKEIIKKEKARRKAKSCDTRLQGKPELDPYAKGKRYGNKIKATYHDIPKEKWEKAFGKKTKQKDTNKKT